MADAKSVGLFHGKLFFMRPCSIRAEIKKIIKDGDGTFISGMRENVIRLTDDKKHTTGYHVDFIYDSIREGALQDLERYRLPKYGFLRCTDTHVAVDLKFRGRQPYDSDEDEAIIAYVMKYHMDYGSTGSIAGNVLWKEMERKKVTSHSWQSMKARYLKHLQHRQQSPSYQPLVFKQIDSRIVSLSNNPPRDHAIHSNEVESPRDNTKRIKKGKRKMFSAKHRKVFSMSPHPADESQAQPTDQKDNTTENIVASNQSVDLFQLISSSDTEDESDVCLDTQRTNTQKRWFHVDSPRKKIFRKHDSIHRSSDELYDSSVQNTFYFDDEDSFDESLLKQAQQVRCNSTSPVESECNPVEEHHYRTAPKNDVIISPFICDSCYTGPSFEKAVQLLREIEQLSSDDEIWQKLAEELKEESFFNL